MSRRIDRRDALQCEICQQKIEDGQASERCKNCRNGFSVHRACVDKELCRHSSLSVVCRSCSLESDYSLPPAWSDRAKTAAKYTVLFLLAGTLPMALLRYFGAFDRISNAEIDRYHVAGSLIIFTWFYVLLKAALWTVNCCCRCRRDQRH